MPVWHGGKGLQVAGVGNLTFICLRSKYISLVVIGLSTLYSYLAVGVVRLG